MNLSTTYHIDLSVYSGSSKCSTVKLFRANKHVYYTPWAKYKNVFFI